MTNEKTAQLVMSKPGGKLYISDIQDVGERHSFLRFPCYSLHRTAGWSELQSATESANAMLHKAGVGVFIRKGISKETGRLTDEQLELVRRETYDRAGYVLVERPDRKTYRFRVNLQEEPTDMKPYGWYYPRELKKARNVGEDVLEFLESLQI